MPMPLMRLNVLTQVVACCAVLIPVQRVSAHAQQVTRPRPVITLAYARPDTSDSRQVTFDSGARLGIAEARHAASLLRRELEVVELSEGARDRSVGTQLEAAQATVVVAPALTASLATQLEQWAARPGRAIVTALASASLVCSMPVFRTGPDSAVRASAAARSDTAARAGGTARSDRVAGTMRAPPVAAPATALRVELWHADLERFGARQLNDRYVQRYGAPMTSAAWEGWMAVKIAWESGLRARDGDVAAALAHGAFDGHKGAALRFGADDRILRQPLIIVASDAGTMRPGSAAVTGKASTALVREIPWPAEDSLAAADANTRSSSRCPS